MAVELATAWVSLVPSTKGIAAQVRNEVGRPLERAAAAAGISGGRSFGANLFSNAVSGLDRLGESIVSKVTTGVKIAGAVGGGVLAAGLFGGLRRALDREEAIITFRRMGLDDANIGQLIDAIDEALRGTPITNPEGFALAGRFLAQGFEAADIPGIVSTLADMSAVGNRSFAEMADVMVAAAGQGRITAAELNRLGDIPLGKVAAELGTTEAGLREMVSAGELTAEAFIGAFAAIDEFNGAAQDQTTRVAFDNLKTAVASLGEQFLSPILGEGGTVQTALAALGERVKGLGPFVEGLGEAFFARLVPAVERAAVWFEGTLIPALQTGVQWFRENRDVIRDLAAAVAPVAAAIGGIAVVVNLVSRISPFGLLITAAAVVVTALRTAWGTSETFRDVVTSVFEAVGGAVETVTGWFGQLSAWWAENGPAIIDRVVELGSAVGDLLGGAFDFVAGVWTSVLEPAFDAIKESLTSTDGLLRNALVVGFDLLVSALTTVGEKLSLVGGWMEDNKGVMQGIATFLAVVFVPHWIKLGVQAALAGAKVAVAWVASAAGGIAAAASTSLHLGGMIARWAWAGVQALFHAAKVALAWLVALGPIALVIAAVVGLATLIVLNWDKIREVISAGWEWVKRSTAKAWDWIKNAVKSAIGFVVDLFLNFTGPGLIIKHWDKIKEVIGAGWDWVKRRTSDFVTALLGFFVRIRDGAVERFESLVTWVRELPGRILTALGNLGRTLFNAGKALLQGLIDGIKSIASRPVDAVKGIVTGMGRLLPRSPPKEGPLSGRGWVLYSGRAIAEDLAAGIGQRARLVEAATRDLAQMARTQVEPALAGITTPSSFAVRADAPAGAAGGPRAAVAIENYIVQNPLPETAADSLPRQTRAINHLFGG